MTTLNAIKTYPWGDEIYVEIPLHKKSANKFYARHGRSSEGREYIEFFKFGPVPNTDGERYLQKLRLYSPAQWVLLKYNVEEELANSIGWDLEAAQQEFAQTQLESHSAANSA